MSTTDTLRILISDNAVIPIVQCLGRNACVLKESEFNYKFTLRDIPADSFIIRFDKFPDTSDVFFKSKNMECRKADYALVSESEKVIMFFELKRSSRSYSSSKNPIAQLKGACCIMDYCEIIADSFLGVSKMFDEFTRRYYIIHCKSSSKRAFSVEDRVDNRVPENAMKYGGAFATFKWLI